MLEYCLQGGCACHDPLHLRKIGNQRSKALPSGRQHRINEDCLEVKIKDSLSCFLAVLYDICAYCTRILKFACCFRLSCCFLCVRLGLAFVCLCVSLGHILFYAWF